MPPTPETVLRTLASTRLVEVGREFGVGLSAEAPKDSLVRRIADAGNVELPSLLRVLGRDELRTACRTHGVETTGRARAMLADRLLALVGGASIAKPKAARDLFVPERDDVVQVRHRQYLVEDVVPAQDGEATRVKLVCLDDDAAGRRCDVFWELELGARILEPEAHGLGEVRSVDEPRTFAAYLHALKWSCVSATDARLFQSPFRAGIKLMAHQLTPLKKALELPRANLFIADDVGAGKTIEAGLVLQELLMRQRADWTLIVAPASVCLQWRDEMEKRFGLRFEIFNRAFVARRRQERGFATNPWSTHSRFIISYQTLRRPEYLDPLLHVLGGRLKKSLLILDEAHTAAPAAASKYAVDSQITDVIRGLSPCFEHHLFLSATPHNGHSNSFSALLNILDGQRFTRGVPVTGEEQLEPVMVRRLKQDLRGLVDKIPERKVGQIELQHDGKRWSETVRWSDTSVTSADLADGAPIEIELSALFGEYTELVAPKSGYGRRPFIVLQKRLLSSIEAFARTLRKHADAVEKKGILPAAALADSDADDNEYGEDEEAVEASEGEQVAMFSSGISPTLGRARELLDRMLDLAERHRDAPDAKVRSLVAWIQQQQCAAAQLGAAPPKGVSKAWGDRRLIIFTEYAATKKYLLQMLGAAIDGTERAEERIAQLHGGMSDKGRAEVQTAFNGSPAKYPVRILLATDAAREGINLQGHCADLVHFDVPWSPAKMEQRNGRIDRTLQAEPVVRCSYFIYPQRAEDRVLQALVDKVQRIQAELGSVGSVVMDKLEAVLEDGITNNTVDLFEKAEKSDAHQNGRETAKRELEAMRRGDKIKAEIDEAGRILEASKRVMDFEPALLKDALDVGFSLASAGPLVANDEPAGSARLPVLPESWASTLDTLRPPRDPDELFWDWRKRDPLPVVFDAPEQMDSGVVQLHLQHPLVQRVLSRFLAQGFSAHDLSRVTVVRSSRDAIARVIAFGRLTLFGRGAVRLHDELVSVAAAWLESKGAGHLKPFADAADRKAVDQLEQSLKDAPALAAIADVVKQKLAASAAGDFAALWSSIREEADARAHEAERKLKARGVDEGEKLKRILEGQRVAIQNVLFGKTPQLQFEFKDTEDDRRQKKQIAEDRREMERRLKAIDYEIEAEPPEMATSYDVVLPRLVPVGLVYLWPSTR